jgi:uncharacterized protein YecE (DUF72 family)
LAVTSIHIGTSGWSYEDWKGPFYPADLPSEDMLAYYAGHFSSVEINSTFYRLPEVWVLDHWLDTVPEGFVFSAKASRYITHLKKLKNPVDTLSPFLDRISRLGGRLGPILFQLPPRWGLDLSCLQAFLESLHKGRRYAFEFRDTSWFRRETWRLLARHDAAFCIYDLDGRLSPKAVTADFVYVRLHGPDGPYRGSYEFQTLAGWAGAISAWTRQGKAVYCYFDNDQRGYAALNALRLKGMLEKT